LFSELFLQPDVSLDDGRTKALPKDADPQPVDGHKCLFRAKLGRKRISTVVTSKEVNKFHLAYVSVLRANMDNLERRKKTDTTKTKVTPKKNKA
ncbi:signal recognition particle domain protein, partial [Ancylostoma duodenale]